MLDKILAINKEIKGIKGPFKPKLRVKRTDAEMDEEEERLKVIF